MMATAMINNTAKSESAVSAIVAADVAIENVSDINVNMDSIKPYPYKEEKSI